MLSKNLIATLFFIFLSIYSCTPQDENDIVNSSERRDDSISISISDCSCEKIIIGTYFFDGTEIWVPNDSELPLQPGNDYFSIEILWEENSLIFKSEEIQFCKNPTKIWSYSDFALQDLSPADCQPISILSDTMDDQYSLRLKFDADFLPCAFESEMAGFKFAVSVY